MKKITLILILIFIFFFFLNVEKIRAWEMECIYEGRYSEMLTGLSFRAKVTYTAKLKIVFSPNPSSSKKLLTETNLESSSRDFENPNHESSFPEYSRIINKQTKRYLEEEDEYNIVFYFSDDSFTLQCPEFLKCYDNARKSEWIFTIKDHKISGFTYVTEFKNIGRNVIKDITSEELYEYKNKGKLSIPRGTPIPLQCSDFEDSHGNIIREIYRIVMIVAPILVILFGSLDFARAIFSGDEETMKKNQMAFLKRLLAAVILFLAPHIVKLMLYLAVEYAGISVPNSILCFFG